MKLVAAADKATSAWLENDSAENFAAMVAADDAVLAAKAAGENMVQLPDVVVDAMMERSVFGTADRRRVARA